MRSGMRRAVGSVAMLAYLAIYIVLAATIGGKLTGAASWAQLPFFAVAGIAWVFPLYPLFKWMGGGRDKPAA